MQFVTESLDAFSCYNPVSLVPKHLLLICTSLTCK